MTIKIASIEVRPDTNSGRYRRYRRSGHIYIFLANESILENMQNRRQRPYTTYKKEVLPQVYEWLNENYYNHSEQHQHKARWSQKAGCSCGCSPGFVVDGSWELMDKNVFVTIE